MAYILDEVWVNNGQLIVAEAGEVPSALGDGVGKVRHSAYIEGPLQVGDAGDFSEAKGTVMIGNDGNMGAEYPLYVKGNAYFDHPNIGDLSSRFNTADKKPKPFDMDHPSKGKGYRLRYACIEGPEVGVYYRGRLKNEKVIRLPYYWKDLVHTESITVQLQPIGAHQDIIVKRWDDEYVYLQAQGALPINCFYHVYAERKDVNALVVEYEGESWSDYPDPSYDDPQFSNKVNTRTA